jgi:hypothetical protein
MTADDFLAALTMTTRDVVIALVIIVLVLAAIYFLRRL